MNITTRARHLTLLIALLCLMLIVGPIIWAQPIQTMAGPASFANSRNYERVTAYLRGVYGPRGYFNVVVGLYSYPLAGLIGEQFNIKPGLMVLDIAPGFPRVTEAQIHHIETISGYSPGKVEIQYIRPNDFAETGPGWRKIRPLNSKNPFVRWFKQNFINVGTVNK